MAQPAILNTIDPRSVAKIYAIMSMVGLAIVSAANFLWGVVQAAWNRELALTTAIFFSYLLDLLINVIMAGLVGLVIGVLGSWLYNWCAKHTGGIKITLENFNDQ